MNAARFFILSLCLVGLANQAFAQGCNGCPADQDQDQFADDLKTALSGLNEQYNVVKINKVTKQVVKGISFAVNFDNRTPSGSIENCDATWLVRLWESEKPQSVKVNCRQ